MSPIGKNYGIIIAMLCRSDGIFLWKEDKVHSVKTEEISFFDRVCNTDTEFRKPVLSSIPNTGTRIQGLKNMG